MVSTRDGAKHSKAWMKGIQCKVFFQTNDHALHQEETLGKINYRILKIFFPEPTKLGTKRSWVKEIYVFSMKGHALFQGKIITIK